MTDALTAELEALIERVTDGNDVQPHNTRIKAAWRKDPFKWARERLRLPMKAWGRYAPDVYRHHQWDGTREPILAASKAIANGMSCAVSSCTGGGKTFFGAVMVLWFLDCWEGAQVITMAPKQDQLTLHIWKEIGRLWELFQKLHPKAQLDVLRIQMRPSRNDWGAVGFPCGVAADETVANKARGFHAEHMLFIIEETTGVHHAILNAVKFTCTAPHNLRLFFGNPDSELDPLATVSKEPGVVAVRVSALDHPNVVANDANVIPGATSRKKVDELLEEYGEDSPLYQSRVRGIAPGQASDALIRRDWLARNAAFSEEQMAKVRKEKGGHPALGVDVANSENGDKACTCYGIGGVCMEVRARACPDANEFARMHVAPYVEGGMVAARRVGIDTVGVGVGAFNELKRLKIRASPLNGGESFWENFAEHEEVFNNLRSQMWWQARKDLMHSRCVAPVDQELWEDLCVVKWFTRNGKIIVESKEDLKKRLGRSPDKGDAFVYWNWIRQAQQFPSFGGTGHTGPVAGI